MSDEDHPSQDWDVKQTAYLSGIAWALHTEGRKLPPYRDVSGAMGHGYYWVGHHNLLHLGASAWWAKGQPWHPTKGLTGKAWSDTLDATTRRVNSLLSRAATKLDYTTNWATWFRSKESFLGNEIKKALPHKGTQLITELEAQYMDSQFKNGIEAYNKLLQGLDYPTIPFVTALANRIKEVGQALRPLNDAVEKVISHRINAIYPSGKREKRLAQKSPLKDLIARLSKTKYIFAYDPCILGGMRAFHVDTSATDEEDLDWYKLRQDYERRVDAIRKMGGNALASLCSTWADEFICPLEEED